MIYLDNAATTRPDLSAVKAAAQFNESLYYNPSALYREGLSVRKELNAAREFICRSLSSKHDLVFTSCGSEADNQAIFGTAKRGAAITTAGEHAAGYKSFAELKNRGIDVSFAPLKKDGSADVDSLLRLVADKKPGLVSVVHVNNETGAINDIGRIAQEVKKIAPSCIFHSDGVQAYGKINCRLPEAVDLYAVSAHKIGGLKGTGALFKKKGLHLPPLIYGGGQENEFRSGTENVFGIKVFEYAARARLEKIDENFLHVKRLNGIMRDKLRETVQFISSEQASPYILTFSVHPIKGEVLLHSLEDCGIIVGNGSACSSKNRFSRVIEACGYPNNDGVIRISFSPENTEEEVSAAADRINELVNRLAKIIKNR